MDINSDNLKDIDELQSDADWESEDEDRDAFKIRNPVHAPIHRQFTTQQLHHLIHEGLIDLAPSYQREVVWTEGKQIRLIDSVFRDIYIPPVVFATSVDEDGEEVRVCVDGKQRLTSIQKFFDGQIPHRDGKTKRSFWFTRPENSKTQKLDVPDEWKQKFSQKLIMCVEYRNLAPGAEREIFQRVQMGVSLTAAEKLQAISSPWATWISDLATKYVAPEDGLSSKLPWSTKRGQDYQCIAQFVYCCMSRPEEIAPTAAKLEKFLSRDDKPTQTFKDIIYAVFRRFWHIAHESNLNYGFSNIANRLAPIEFVFVGVLLYEMHGDSEEACAEAISKMRQFVREHHGDVRANTQVCKTFWEFIRMINRKQVPLVPQPIATRKSRKRGSGTVPEDEDYKPVMKAKSKRVKT